MRMIEFTQMNGCSITIDLLDIKAIEEHEILIDIDDKCKAFSGEKITRVYTYTFDDRQYIDTPEPYERVIERLQRATESNRKRRKS